MVAVGMIAGLVRWGFQDMFAAVAACTWFASPAMAVGLMTLMVLSMDESEVKQLPLSHLEDLSHPQPLKKATSALAVGYAHPMCKQSAWAPLGLLAPAL